MWRGRGLSRPHEKLEYETGSGSIETHTGLRARPWEWYFRPPPPPDGNDVPLRPKAGVCVVIYVCVGVCLNGTRYGRPENFVQMNLILPTPGSGEVIVVYGCPVWGLLKVLKVWLSFVGSQFVWFNLSSSLQCTPQRNT